jgi:hypothetical protein
VLFLTGLFLFTGYLPVLLVVANGNVLCVVAQPKTSSQQQAIIKMILVFIFLRFYWYNQKFRVGFSVFAYLYFARMFGVMFPAEVQELG